MSNKLFNTRVKHKKDTLANWTNNNPVLLDGEIGFVNDNGVNRMKVGDGTTTFNNLPYVGGGSSVQSNWNENDNTDPSFVQNRTHWTETTSVIIPESPSSGYYNSDYFQTNNPYYNGEGNMYSYTDFKDLIDSVSDDKHSQQLMELISYCDIHTTNATTTFFNTQSTAPVRRIDDHLLEAINNEFIDGEWDSIAITQNGKYSNIYYIGNLQLYLNLYINYNYPDSTTEVWSAYNTYQSSIDGNESYCIIGMFDYDLLFICNSSLISYDSGITFRYKLAYSNTETIIHQLNNQYIPNLPLSKLSDFNVSSPSGGQVLKYDAASSKWINANESGGGSGIPTLTSPVTIWNLDPGVYIIPDNTDLRFEGASSITSQSIDYGGILNVWSASNSMKFWDVWSSNNPGQPAYPEQRFYGYTTSSFGECMITEMSSKPVTNDGGYVIGMNDSENSISNLNNITFVANGWYIGYITTSAQNKPVSLSLSSNTNAIIKTTNSRSAIHYENYSGYLIRQDLYLPTLNKHYYRNIQVIANSVTPNTQIQNADQYGWIEVFESLPTMSGHSGDVLTVNQNGDGVEWSAGGGGGGASNLYDLNDVQINSATNGQVLTYNSTSQKWENAASASGSTTLSGLTDVSINSSTNGQVLTYNSTSQKWENAAATGATITLRTWTTT